MAVLFPFNKLPGIPSIVMVKLMPIFVEQRDKLTNLALEIVNDVAEVASNAVCDDPKIKEIKNKLKQLETAIQNVRGILDFINPIVDIFNTIKTVGIIIGAIMLAIPTVVGAPVGTFESQKEGSADLIQNIDDAIKKIRQEIAPIIPIFAKVTGVILIVNSLLQNICNEGVDLADTDVLPSAENNESPEPESGDSGTIAGITGTYVTADDILSQYPSEFYQDVNVADDDIQARLDLILQLLQEQLDVISNLNESPSDIIIRPGAPLDNIGQLNDYYIDNNTQQVYGPKPTDTSWE